MGQWGGNASSKPCQCFPPPHTHPVPPFSHPVMAGIPRTLSGKSKQPGSKKNRLGRVTAMCRLSACQAYFFFEVLQVCITLFYLPLVGQTHRPAPKLTLLVESVLLFQFISVLTLFGGIGLLINCLCILSWYKVF